jgi:hypothetical protein
MYKNNISYRVERTKTPIFIKIMNGKAFNVVVVILLLFFLGLTLVAPSLPHWHL